MIERVCRASSPAPRLPPSDVVLAPGVLVLFVSDGTARLLDLEGNFYAVSTVGAAMLRETLDNGIAATVQQIAAVYGIETEQVRADLLTMLRDLARKGVIRRRRNSAPRHRWRQRLANVAIPPLLTLADRRTRRAPRQRAWGLLALAWLSIASFGWSAAVRAWQRHYSRLSIRRYTPARGEQAARLDAVVRTVTAEHLLNIDCKERALACWAMLRAEGLPAEMVIGVDLFPFASHCWCELAGAILSDFADRCERFTPVQRYGLAPPVRG
jgi:hypothetical protein